MKFGSVLFAAKENYRLIVIGGGTGGCAVASKFARLIPRKQIAVVEPQTNHFYQPGLTLAAAGLMPHEKLIRSEFSVLPFGVDWHRSAVHEIVPNQNKITLNDGKMLKYEYLVISTGLELRYDLIEGLAKGRQSVMELADICSIYFPEGARKTQALLNAFQRGGKAIFTFPNTPIKCAGAPQKICYLAEEIFRNRMVREESRIIYCTSLGRIFGVPKYADALMKIITERDIELEIRLNLCKVDPAKKVATFQKLDENGKDSGERKEFEYNFLHIGPPCSSVPVLRKLANSEEGSEKRLTDGQGFVKVDPKTLQSPSYPNVFAIGDCANTPNAKTAAAISSQLKAMSQHLKAAMEKQGKIPEIAYDGYASCPLVVDSKHAILAEFNGANLHLYQFNPQGPLETFPYDQSKPTRFAFFLKRYAMPPLYWIFLLKGYWNGPSTFRKILHPFEWFKKTKKS